LFDPHCHLDDPAFAEPTLDLALRQALQAGVGSALVPGFGPGRWPRQSELLLNQRGFLMWGAFGLHPWAVDPAQDIDSLRLVLERGWQDHAQKWGEGLVAVGEFGLDRSRRGQVVPWDLQGALFGWHLQRARLGKLPVILHLVRSHGAALEQLTAQPPPGGVVHAFGGPVETVPAYLELGLCLSFGSALMHREKARESLRATPPEQMMFETDAPGGLKGDFPPPLGPAHLPKIVEAASQVLGKSVEYLLARHRENCARVFGLPLLLGPADEPPRRR
jgi:TatD DNase family protein